MVQHPLTGPTISSTCRRPTPNERSPWNRTGWPTCSEHSTSQSSTIQKDVVKNEYRQNYANRPYGMVWPLIAETLYPPQHPYSWMTIGVMEDLDRATMEDVSAFFRKFYVPSNASLTIVGDLDEDTALALAERYFEPIPGGSRARAAVGSRGGLQKTADVVLRDRVELDRLYLDLADCPPFPRRRRGAADPGRRAGSRPIEPPASQARHRRADRPGRDGLSIGPGARRVVRDHRHAHGRRGRSARRGASSNPSCARSRPRA